ncbi:MAG TPA: hypothetical protein VG389_00765 [Myxococcota bacterium]|nr:hypothetical protein [Myxococcota bacterium]
MAVGVAGGGVGMCSAVLAGMGGGFIWLSSCPFGAGCPSIVRLGSGVAPTAVLHRGQTDAAGGMLAPQFAQ